MAITPSYPGLYIMELPNTSHTITAAPTSVTVFIGYSQPFKTLPQNFNQPVEIFGFTDYQRNFGGFFRSDAFDAESNLFGDLAQAVNQFFLNGGSDAWVVALDATDGGARFSPAQSAWIGPLQFTALEITDSDHVMTITVGNASSVDSPLGSPLTGDDTCDVTITFGPPSTSPLSGYGMVAETYRGVSLVQTLASGKPNPNFIGTVIGRTANPVSSLVTVAVDTSRGLLVDGSATLNPAVMPAQIFNVTDFTNVLQQDSPLDKLHQLFNLMVIPGVTDGALGSVLATASSFCERKRAFLIMDPPQGDSADGSGDPAPNSTATAGNLPLIENTMEGNTTGENIPFSKNSAIYFPYLEVNDPITGLAADPTTTPPTPYEIPPSGTVAGIFAQTDIDVGVWKAPAGLATLLTNVNDVVDRGKMTDQRQGVLNPLGVNCIRNFPGIGPVVFGARTSVAANPAYQQWMYVPVRRMALFIEQSLYQSLGWVVFEPNDDPLWTAITSSIQAFMLSLFRQGAFQGSTPSEAFQVKCDSQTTTQDDIDQGIVNIVVAFAPLKPAEFVIIQIAQMAGQTQS